jgi:tetrahydromethanopterin S-methyltransferase subunit H
MKKFLFSLTTVTLLFFNLSSAQADPTYAVLDSNGNVTNIIVCGSACASGEFGGQRVVPQVAPNPVTNENRGGFWYGPGTTTYDSNTGVFTAVDSTVVTNSFTEEEDGTIVTSSATIYGGATTQFKYSDTIGDNLFTRNGFSYGYLDNTAATISVNKNNNTESIDFNSRQTVNEIQESVQNSGLALLNSKVQTLISLLGGWVK